MPQSRRLTATHCVFITQLSRDGQSIKQWLLSPTNPSYQSATVPGGFMYVCTM
jgi:hypothetical protein